jgi:hypothetical protein
MDEISSLTALEGILSTPLTKEDLQNALGNSGEFVDADFVEQFEEAWQTFLKDHPPPKGERECRIILLQKQIQDLHLSRQQEEIELKKQMNSFQTSRELLEEQFHKKRNKIQEEQRAVKEELDTYLDSVAKSDHLQKFTLPWLHFFSELDRVVQEKKEQESHRSEHILQTTKTTNTSVHPNKVAKPSDQALFLTEKTIGDSESDILLRANRIDNALLHTRIDVLEKEIERYEKLMETQNMVGEILAENDVWGVLRSSIKSGSKESTKKETFGTTDNE